MMDEAQIRHDLRAYLTRPGALVLDERGAGCCRTDRWRSVARQVQRLKERQARPPARRAVPGLSPVVVSKRKAVY